MAAKIRIKGIRKSKGYKADIKAKNQARLRKAKLDIGQTQRTSTAENYMERTRAATTDLLQMLVHLYNFAMNAGTTIDATSPTLPIRSAY